MLVNRTMHNLYIVVLTSEPDARQYHDRHHHTEKFDEFHFLLYNTWQ